MTRTPARDLDPEYVRSGTRALVALALVGVVVVALAFVPIVVGQRIDRFSTVITDVLQPSLETTARVSLEQARQLARLQRVLLTNDPTLRNQYVRGIEMEDSLYAVLNEQVRPEEFEIRRRLAALSAESTRWHFENQRAFGRVADGLGAEGLGQQSQETYDQLQLATRELERAIRSSMDSETRAMAQWRQIQIWFAIGLAVVALGTTFVVARVGRRLRRLNAEADRRRIEAVRARREIDALLEATGEGVLGIDSAGKCTSLNRRGAELLGFTEGEILGRDAHETIYHTTVSGESRDREASPMLRELKRGARLESEDGDVLWRRNRTSFPARWTLAPLLDGTWVRGTVLTFADMTEIRDKEAALRRAVDQREEVVSIVSHDLRNPLGVVAAASDLLIDLPLDEEERRAQAEIIRRSAERMERLIEDLLDVANIEAGAFVVRPASEEPGPILAEARDRFEREAQNRDVSVCVVCSDDAPVIRMDRDRVLQALGNLIDNAIRYSPIGQSVQLSVETIDDDWAALVVRNEGEGIPVDLLPHLFDRFWQGGGDRGKAGLGLAIVRGIAEAHGGDVRVESEPGQGATFRLVLPRGTRRTEP